MKKIIYVLLISLVTLGCSDKKISLDCQGLYDMVEEDAEKASSVLMRLDKDKLTDEERNYVDFLSIKCQDKRYVTHVNDSLVLKVLDFVKSNGPKELYPEVLYYTGRVYCDIGDYPSALNYFQLALMNIENSHNNIKLEGNVISQLARLLTALRLYKESLPYAKRVVKIGREQGDTINEVYDLQLLGSIYRRMGDYDKAECCYQESLTKSRNLVESIQAKARMHMADLLFHKGYCDSALYMIRGVPDKVSDMSRDAANAVAVKIYESAGIYDTAYMYSRELISHNSANKVIGYNILLRPGVRKFLTSDSVDYFIDQYVGLLENYYDENENQLAVNQQAFYNYAIHDREKMKTQASVGKLVFWILISILAILSLGVIILLQGNRNKNNMLKLRDAIDEAARLQCVVNSLKDKDKAELKDSADEESCGCRDDCISKGESLSQLRKKLQRRLLELQKQCETDPVNLSPIITESGVYAKLTDIINSGKGIPDDDPIWDEVEEVVVESSPNFRKNMKLLLGDKNSSFDLHTTLLIKCGVSPSKMGILLNRTKGTIVSRRESLSMRMLDQKLGTRIIDDIIRLL